MDYNYRDEPLAKWEQELKKLEEADREWEKNLLEKFEKARQEELKEKFLVNLFHKQKQSPKEEFSQEILTQTLKETIAEEEAIVEKHSVVGAVFLSFLFLIFIGANFYDNTQNFTDALQKTITDAKNPKKNPSGIINLSNVDTIFTDNLAFKEGYIEINSLVSNATEQREMNGIVKLKNDYLTLPMEYTDMSRFGRSTANFNAYLNEKNIPFLYVQIPHKLPSDVDKQVPYGFDTYPNRSVNTLTSFLKLSDVPILDLREEIKNDELDHYELFYKTDSHWTTEAGFWAHTKILEAICEMLGTPQISTQTTDLENYKIQVYKNIFLGSRGHRTGVNFSGLDDFSLISPLFESSITLQIPRDELDVTGTFRETIIFDEHLKTEVNSEIYNAYLKGLENYKKITNHMPISNQKIFLIHDSFSLPVAPFLGLYYEEVHMYDLRSEYDGNNIEMLQILDEVNPDIVIVAYYPQSITHELFAFLP